MEWIEQLREYRASASAEDFEYLPLEDEHYIKVLDRSTELRRLIELGYRLVGDRVASPGDYAMRMLISPSGTTIAYGMRPSGSPVQLAFESQSESRAFSTARGRGLAGPPEFLHQSLPPESSTDEMAIEHEKFIAAHSTPGELLVVETLDDVLTRFRWSRLRGAQWRNAQHDDQLLRLDLVEMFGDEFGEHELTQIGDQLRSSIPSARLLPTKRR